MNPRLTEIINRIAEVYSYIDIHVDKNGHKSRIWETSMVITILPGDLIVLKHHYPLLSFSPIYNAYYLVGFRKDLSWGERNLINLSSYDLPTLLP